MPSAPSSIKQAPDGRWSRECPSCGQDVFTPSLRYAKAAERRSALCQTCNNRNKAAATRRENTHGELIPLTWLRKNQASAKTRNIEWALDAEDIQCLYIIQGGLCALSGMPIDWSKKGRVHTASIDRIDPTIGYLPTNIQLVHKDINRMKQSFQQLYFITLCHSVSAHRPTR